MLHYRLIKTSWGPFAIVARENRLVASYLPRPQRVLADMIRRDWSGAKACDDLLPDLAASLLDYFDGCEVELDAAIDLVGLGPFHRRVLEATRRIPYGQTTSYGALARRAGSPNAARAVGAAMATNPMPIIIPCHRVLRSDGHLGGFSSHNGVADKRRLLEMEAATCSLATQA